MARFYGTYRYAADTKGRMNVPAPFRKAIAGEPDDTFWVTVGLERCLKVYAHSDWERLEKVFEAIPMLDEEGRTLAREVFGHARPESFDKQGRILIHKELREYANIKKDVVIVGLRDHFEIWAAEEREHAKAAAPPLNKVAQNTLKTIRDMGGSGRGGDA